MAFALILQAAFLIAFFITPTFEEYDDDDLFNNPNFFQELILREPEEKKEKKEDLSGKKAAQRKDDEGLFGKKDKPKEDKVASAEGAPVVDKDKREEDRKIAMEALAALGLGPESQVSDVMGPGGLGSGINNALGGLRGTAMGEAGGAGGLGTRGTGAGVVATPWASATWVRNRSRLRRQWKHRSGWPRQRHDPNPAGQGRVQGLALT